MAGSGRVGIRAGVEMRHAGRKERVRGVVGTVSRREQSQGVERCQYSPSEDWLQGQQCMEWYHNDEACGNSLALCDLYTTPVEHRKLRNRPTTIAVTVG